jgi:hypothetical protein
LEERLLAVEFQSYEDCFKVSEDRNTRKTLSEMLINAASIGLYRLISALAQFLEYSSEKAERHFHYRMFKQRACRSDIEGVKELAKIFPRMRESLVCEWDAIAGKVSKCIFQSFRDIVDPSFIKSLD